MITKVLSKNNEYWLIEQKRVFLGIIVGDAVRLTRKNNDDYYFINNVQIISQNEIVSTLSAEENEVLFFDYVKRMKEVPIRKFIVNDFGVERYILD